MRSNTINNLIFTLIVWLLMLLVVGGSIGVLSILLPTKAEINQAIIDSKLVR